MQRQGEDRNSRSRAPSVQDALGPSSARRAARLGPTGFAHTLRFLVERYGVAVNIIDDQNRTALHWAAREGFLECCKYLVGKGCNLACKVQLCPCPTRVGLGLCFR